MTPELKTPTTHYDFQAIEKRWQDYWAENATFQTANPGQEGFDPGRPKFYVLDMFPYPSGMGLHVGHPLGYIATDIVARYKRMRGFNVLHPMGYDAFGLPAEQYAIETGVHPRETTEKNIANMNQQLRRLGLGYDWDRSFATIDVHYYRWTQWIFLQLYDSYFDPETSKAAPIEQLQRKLESGEYDVGTDGELIKVGGEGLLDALGGVEGVARKWHELEIDQQRALLDEYRLAYIAEVPVNWCPGLGTVLANEEVTQEGRSERGNYPVYKRPLRQWMLRITAYADRLLADLDTVDWPEPIKLMQRNWIGRSEGAEVDFAVSGTDEVIRVFTTRPDTLFGSTYMVLAPEHPLVELIATADKRESIRQYQQVAASQSDVDRQVETRQKTGVFTGAYAINQANNKPIPIWIADYVMMGYGTGAIMAVPAHDNRDHEFARTFDLPITQVVRPPDDVNCDVRDEAYTGKGTNIHSTNDELSLDGQPTCDAQHLITQWLASKGLGKARIQYKLRDWLFSRQRYWGEPFPILHGPSGRTHAVAESELPVELPEMRDFKPKASDDPQADPQPPLGRARNSWKLVTQNASQYTRELNTMPQWAGSCWYYLRFCEPDNHDRFVGEDAERYWMAPNGVDLYVGGVEHAVLHLLYARFWHKVLYDLGHVSTAEPFGKLFNQGYIQAYCYRDERGIAVPFDEVVDQDGHPAMDVQDQKDRNFFYHDKPVVQELGKMGKSLKNAVAPDEICEQYGADTLRLYEMYLGPLDQSKPWATRDIVGAHRFLQRLWRNFVDEKTGEFLVSDQSADPELRKKLHKTIRRVSEAMDTMAFNVAIAALIELNNKLVQLDRLPREVAENLLLCLAPLAPHVCEDLWHRLGGEDSIADAEWPDFDPSLVVDDLIQMPVQVNGKLRSRIQVAADADDATIEQAARGDEKVAAAIAGKQVRKVIVVQGRLVNLVVG